MNLFQELGSPAPWMQDALCAEVGGDLWFPERGEPATIARQICGRCPAVAACLQYAVDNNEIEGFWGNTSPEERQRMRKA